MPLPSPTTLLHAIAQLGDFNAIPDASAGPGIASIQLGFPVECEEPLTSGGIPPDRKDINGLLYLLSQYAQWQEVGGPFIFNATLSTAIGGYPVGATVRDNAGGEFFSFVNFAANNTNDPANPLNISPAGGWDFFATKGPGTTFGRVSWLVDYSSGANVVRLHSAGYLNYVVGGEGQILAWNNAFTNTGACTIIAGPVATTPLPLVDSQGNALQAGALVAGQVAMAIWDSNANQYKLVSPLPSGKDVGPSTGTGITSGSAQMFGLGGGFAFTPKKSGLCMVTLSGFVADATAANAAVVAYFGTGAAPANGAAVPGGAVSFGPGLAIAVPANGSNGVPISIPGVVQLVAGTPYWFDLALSTSAGTLTAFQCHMAIMES